MAYRWDIENKRNNCIYCAVEGCDSRKQEFSAAETLATVILATPRVPDEIDDWIIKECGIYPGACSSIESIKYYTAREVAEKLWNGKPKKKKYDRTRKT